MNILDQVPAELRKALETRIIPKIMRDAEEDFRDPQALAKFGPRYTLDMSVVTQAWVQSLSHQVADDQISFESANTLVTLASQILAATLQVQAQSENQTTSEVA